MQEKDVILDIARVEDGATDDVHELYDEIRERREEATECLDELNVLSESAFLRETDEGTYFLTYVEAEDWEETQERYQESERELDQTHLQVLSEALAESDSKNVELEPVLHIVADPEKTEAE